MDVHNVADMQPFITKDGSEIRELLAHRNSAIRNQSLAEARVPVGGSTQEHYHPRAEEIYFITAGAGRMRIENETRDVKVGDAIAILPGKNGAVVEHGKRDVETALAAVRRVMSIAIRIITEIMTFPLAGILMVL